MNSTLVALVGITGLFVLFLAARRITGMKFCALCASVSSTWFMLLVLRWVGYTVDLVLIGVLIGESVVGVYYLWEKRVAERFHIFRLPVLLSLTLVAYLLLGRIDWYGVVLVLVVLGLSALVYALREHPRVRRIAEQIIVCCKGW